MLRATRFLQAMRILHIFDHSIPLHSGYTFRSRAILHQQRSFGWQTEHLTGPKQGHTESMEEWVDDLHFYRTAALSQSIAKVPVLNQLEVVRRLAHRIEEVARQFEPSLLHAHSPALNGLAALKVGDKMGLPVTYEVRAFWEDAAVDHGTSTERGPRYRLSRALETHVLRRADAITTICEGLRNEILGRGVAQEKVWIIPNAVDPQQFASAAVPDRELVEQLGLSGKVVLGFIGSFYAYEGLNLLLQALPEVLSEQPALRLLLVGGGPQEERLRQLVDDLRLDNIVIFTGRVPHREVLRYYDLVDVFVYPRLPMRLTNLVTPIKPLEAMASRRLVVASDVGGHRELIRDRETGYLFRAGDARDLADTVLALLNDRDKWQSLRRQGRELIDTERNWKTVVSRYRDVYRLARGQ